ncbi:helix-turn-helix domain-containing protein [Spongiactinospora sp. TRM90649]|uniref:helix-turn-helix domain-containing protein n=1 Tax=Spongiactinospora sp. TRM90649 TaxID=3031114 RepID=UPI0023F76303|nr:helix-turn-helix domain-containing protein [Spongiactinospora sp. TRM90649]MDF5756610.1 helix-turn-helix domain-containing protein [Spongiactinospora sp. TRM90649]
MTKHADVSTHAYVTVAEFAERFGLSKMTVYRAVQSGDVPAIRIGRSYRIAKAVVEEFDRRAGATPPRAPIQSAA